jgi:MFS superfamily sulfate permease-like transporter
LCYARGETFFCCLFGSPKSLTNLTDRDSVITQFCASLPGIFYALLGTSRQLNVGPTAAVSLLLGQAVSDIHMQFPEIALDRLKVHVTTVVGLQVSTCNTRLCARIAFLTVGKTQLNRLG